MKTAHNILLNLSNKPQFKKLGANICYKKFISILSKKWQEAIAFIYIKEETLFIAITHPGFKMELHYNKDLLKSLWKQFINIEKSCNLLQINQIIIFHSKFYTPIEEKQQLKTVPYYKEKSNGDFILPNKKSKLYDKFLIIQEIICNK